MLQIELPEDVEKQLDDLASSTGRTKSDLVREAVIEQIDDLEDIYLAEQALRNPGRRYTLEEVKQELGLED